MKKFIPDQSPKPVVQSGSGLKKKEETSIMTMLLKLASARAYDGDGQIIDMHGNIVPGSNVAKLTAYACRSEPYLEGKTEFVQVLSDLGITQIPNQNLMGSTEKDIDSPPPTPMVPSTPVPLIPPPPPLSYHGPRHRSLERSRSRSPQRRSRTLSPSYRRPMSQPVDGRQYDLPSDEEGTEIVSDLEWDDEAQPQRLVKGPLRRKWHSLGGRDSPPRLRKRYKRTHYYNVRPRR